ncbi:MAG: ornithine cyclodeaminase family protein, partial [Fretibacterium sp.]|nr:ornithine cyclodeaminase family protein [Fretibacterium sp.]
MRHVALRYLSQEHILGLKLSTRQIVDAVEKVLRSHGKGLVQMPPKPAIFPRKGRYNYFHAMPAYIEDLDICGLKWL